MFNRVLVPVDLDVEQSWRLAIPVAEEFARAWGSEIHVMTVVPGFGMSLVGSHFSREFEHEVLERARVRLAEIVAEVASAPDRIARHVAHGTIYEEIIAAAERLGADTIVMTSHRPELRDYLIGPNAARVTRHAPQSVFVIREQG